MLSQGKESGCLGKLRITWNSITVWKNCFMRIIYFLMVKIKKKKDPTKCCGKPEPAETISVLQREHWTENVLF